MPIEKRTFEGGMNTDLAEGLLKPNQYRYALNIRNGNSERGAVGEITNAEGNQEFSTSLPSGNNKVIGAKDDEANDRVIYIVYNDLGDNRILLYDYRNLLFKTIVADSGNVLGLNSEYLISSIDVIVGEDTSYLLFTDNFSEPKNIDIEEVVPFLEEVELIDVRELVGKPLYDSLKDKYINQTLDDNEIELVNLLKRGISYKSASQALPFLNTKITSKGVQKLRGDYSEAGSMEEMKYLRRELENKSEYFFGLVIPFDDMLKILAQTIVILIANRRADLIPLDFSGKK